MGSGHFAGFSKNARIGKPGIFWGFRGLHSQIGVVPSECQDNDQENSYKKQKSCSGEFLFIPDTSRGGGWNIPRPVPATSQTIPPPAFSLCNTAKSDLIRSRRNSLNNSGPVPHFSEL